MSKSLKSPVLLSVQKAGLGAIRFPERKQERRGLDCTSKAGQERKSTSPKCRKLRIRQGEETMQKRMHSREFKLDVVRQIATGQKRPAQICREYGLADSVLSRWRKEYQERGEAAFSPSQSAESTTQGQRMAELERLCGQLALENQVLKKALQSKGLRSVTP